MCLGIEPDVALVKIAFVAAAWLESHPIHMSFPVLKLYL